MTSQPKTRVTDTTERVWAECGNKLVALNNEMLKLQGSDQTLGQMITTDQEQPTALHVQGHMLKALDVMSAARAHYRELERLYVLCGGDVRPRMREAA